MKTRILHSLFTFALSLVSISVTAQNWTEDPKYGSSPEERQENVQNFNLFRDAYNNKNFDAAVVFLPDLFEKVPSAFVNLYVYSANIYRTKIAQSTSLAEKNAYIDTLMTIYDTRAMNFAKDKGKILGMKAKDYLANKPMDRDNVSMLFQDAILAQGDQNDFGIINLYFKQLTDDYKSDNIEATFLMNEYERLAEIYDKADQNEAVQKERSTFDALLVSSGAASCDNLEALFKANIEAAPNDKDVLSKAISFLTRAKCNSAFLLETMEKLYAISPTSELAMELANSYGEVKNNAKSLQYLNQAIAAEEDLIKKSNLAVQIAARELTEKKNRMAIKFAREAITYNPNNGYAFIILAQSLAISTDACQGFDASTVYWLVVDNLNRAKRLLDQDDPQQETIAENIANYTQFFPSKEECFFRGLTAGAPFSVSCDWIKGKTTVREGR